MTDVRILGKGLVQDIQDTEVQAMIQKAMDVRSLAYCPYSKFRVGSAVLTKHNSLVFTGCNVENASYGLTICAERVAICAAVASGYREFKAIAVCCDIIRNFTGPCGVCRQTLVEFGQDWDLYMVKPNQEYIRVKVSDMLPMGFYPVALEEERITDA